MEIPLVLKNGLLNTEEISNNINLSGFLWACKDNHLQLAKGFHERYAKEFTNDDYKNAFISACSEGHIDIASWLHDIKIMTTDIYEEAFFKACDNEKIKVIYWLNLLRCGEEIQYDKIFFSQICAFGKLKIANWMCEKNKIFYVEEKDGEITGYGVRKLKCKFSKKIEEKEECNICYGDSNIITSCDHYGCEECFIKWAKKSCPVCRQDIEYFVNIE